MGYSLISRKQTGSRSSAGALRTTRKFVAIPDLAWNRLRSVARVHDYAPLPLPFPNASGTSSRLVHLCRIGSGHMNEMDDSEPMLDSDLASG